ncbi:MAG: TonB-dependent receptor domain-containing protein, partial [Bacteroidia bacterium]
FSFNLTKGQSFKGRVINSEDNTPIPYATVYFTDLHTGVSCNENGTFEYHKQLPTSIKIKFSALGFQEKKIIIHQKDLSDSLIISLTPSHIELKELTISSTTGILQRYSITNIEIKSIKEIQINAPSNLGEAISNIPSVYQVSTGLGISKPVIRGLTGLRIVTLLNGLRIENQQWGGDHGMGVTENGIGTVEVIKGPSSLLYGADALGGVLYFTDENYALNNEIEAKIESRFESFTKGSNNFITVKTNKNNWRFNIHGNYNNQADFAIPEKLFVKNSRFKEQNFKTSVGYNFKNWIINFRYNYLHNRIGIPGHTHDSIIKPELFKTPRQLRENTIPAQLITNHYAMLENKFFFNYSDLSIIIGKTLNNLSEYEEKVTIPGIDMLLDNTIYNARYTHSFTQKMQLIIGTQGMYQISSNSDNATEILLPNASMFDKGLYALWHIQTNTIEFQSGVRYDSRTISAPSILKDDGSNFSFYKNYAGFNYSIGINKKLNHFLFRTNASSGFRPPHLTELLSDGVHHGALRYEVGNKFLKNEFSQQLDIGIEFNNEHLSILVNPFYQYLQNFIYIAPNGSMKNGVPQFLYKQSNYATLAGGDLAIHYHPHFYHPL